MTPVFRLMLDEMMSPTLGPRLWEAGVDNYPVRDRGLLRATDPVIWRYAKQDDRTLVTVNEGHFRRLASRDENHPGILLVPDGGTRDRQFEYVMAGIDAAISKNGNDPSFANCIYKVREDCSVAVEYEVIKKAHSA